MTRPWLPWAVVVGVGALAGWLAVDGFRRDAVYEERLRVSDSTVAALSKRTRVTDTVYRRDTVRLTRRETRWRDSVVARIDTLADTVRVPVEVVRWVVAEADSTIHACRAVVLTCEQRVAQRDTLIALREQQVAALKRMQPSRWGRWLERAAWVGAVVLVAR